MTQDVGWAAEFVLVDASMPETEMRIRTSCDEVSSVNLAPAPSCEPHHEVYFRERPVTLGPMTGATWRWNPRRLGMMLARYKFVSKMLVGKGGAVAEIGCADGFGSEVVKHEVGGVDLYDRDSVWEASASEHGPFRQHDIVADGRLKPCYDAIYMLDVFEHICPDDEADAMRNIGRSLTDDGVFIAGCPTLESQAYAFDHSKVGHVNCKTGDEFRRFGRRWFRNVFLFGMNDEMIHVGFAQMCHYHFILCTQPKRSLRSTLRSVLTSEKAA